MEWKGRRRSSNVGRGSSGGRGGMGLPVGGGIGGIIILLLFYFLSGGNSNIIAPGSGLIEWQQPESARVDTAELDNELEEFLAVVLADTEDVWHEIFKEEGKQYTEPKLILYDTFVQTACGSGSSEMGPFYCPGDKHIYIDPSFYYELRDEFGAPGDFALAYVLAHEVGHHVQYLAGVTEKVFALKNRLPEEEFNKVLVRLELQADYYAGVFAHYIEGKGYLEAGDIEEAMNAAAAVGDDTIQSRVIGQIIPDKFTHGTAKQRQEWFNLGYQFGDIKHGDTFSADNIN